MKNRFSKMTISGQIKYYFILLFLILFLLCGALYFAAARQIMTDSEDNTLEYGLRTVENNMESLMDNINGYSKAIAFNDTIQKVMRMDAPLSYDNRMKLSDAVVNMAACCDGLSSIYLFDHEGESYVAGNIYEVETIKMYLEHSALYRSTLEEQGIDLDSSVIFSYEAQASAKSSRFVSFARLVRDLDTLDVLGIVAMNVSEHRITETWESVRHQMGMEAAILDKDGNRIAGSMEISRLQHIMQEEMPYPGKDFYTAVKYDGKSYKAGMIESENGAWRIVGMIPRSETLNIVRQYMLLTVLVLIFGMAMCVFGASYLTQKMTGPIRSILISMENVGDKRLEPVPVIETNQEIDNLQRHYNQMLEEAKRLMDQRVEEQRMRRKYELSLLQAQIKPHFLYNTFDSVCALAMMGKTKDVYTMMQALGLYYRNSLHKGQEIITVGEELEIVKNYLIIQSFRFDDVFDTVYDVDESVMSCRMIKLILQPLVENAIYHGFREPELTGTIFIRAKEDGDYVRLSVEDNGAGMEPEQLERILNKASDDPGKRFGLFGTLRRISLYYQQEDRKQVDIRSEKGKGTMITVWIPRGTKEHAEGFGD